MKITYDRRSATLTIRGSGTITRSALMAILGVPNPKATTVTIVRAFRSQTEPEDFQQWLLHKHDVPKGTASKMTTILRSLYATEFIPNELKGRSVNWAYQLIKFPKPAARRGSHQ